MHGALSAWWRKWGVHVGGWEGWRGFVWQLSQMLLSAAKCLLNLLTTAGKVSGASPVLAEIARVDSLPCDTFEQFREREEAGAQRAHLMPIRVAQPALHL